MVYNRLGIDVPWKNDRDIWWEDVISNQSYECETMHMDSEDYSMIIFSSGTTGKPKGTVHTHGGALAQIAKELGYYFYVKENDVFFWLTDIGWMMGPWMIIGVQNFGGNIVVFEGAPNYQFHESGSQGSPVEPKSLNELRSCFSTHSSP